MEHKQHIDIVMLSWAKDDTFKKITLDAIRSLYMSENDINFNVIVVESNHDVVYPMPIITMHLNEPNFNYNRFANEGIKAGCSEYILFCNNDLFFHKGWASEMLLYGFDSMSPMSLTSPSQQKFRNERKPLKGYNIAQELPGWAIMIKRSVWNMLGGLDERVTFWCSDDCYAEQLKSNKIEHHLIPTALVNHLDGGSNTLKGLDNKTKEQLTFEQARVFNKIFSANKFNLNKN